MNVLNQNYGNHGKNLVLQIAIAIGMLLMLATPVLAASLPVTSPPVWRYGGVENPSQWGKLSNDFALCESGRDQSPINIKVKDAVEGTAAKIDFDYKPSPLVVVNNGHTIQVNYAKGSTANIDGQKYALLQFHFHTPSEHEINDKASAMELHLVHRNEMGKFAVVGVMLTEGKANPLIQEVWKNIPAIGKTNTVSDRMINALSLLPNSKSYFSYDGSLTTPPCSEGVQWNILVEPTTVSEAQIETFEKIYQVDARPIQLTNRRTVQLHH